ncbi:hypothetical protein [Anaerotignum sp.]|nr:hypothetical protein [Anaerotignum sp.]MCI5680180.1 hypothetical protein [Bacteroidales bacterium]MDY3926871.1 hypothetical protein [Anaerotignum sp.]
MKIDGLKLPQDVSCTAEKQNFDTSRRTVSGRLITKLSPVEKWKVTVDFENLTLSIPFQTAFYEKCMEMRNVAAVVEFTDPYTGKETSAIMRCVSRKSPSALDIVRRQVRLYQSIGAVFEEV